MGTRFVFPSLAEPNIRYAIYSSAFDARCSNSGFSDYLVAFDTMGDGEVQHSPEWRPQADKLLDVLQSLALRLPELEPDQFDNAIVAMLDFWPSACEVDRERIEFAAGLKFKEDAKAFNRRFSVELKQVSTADGKRHDKRFTSLDSWHDASFQATMRILHEYESPRTWLHAIARGIQVCDAVERYGYHNLISWLKLTSYSWNDLWSAYRTVDLFVRGWESLRSARSCADCLRGNLANSARRASLANEETTEAVA